MKRLLFLLGMCCSLVAGAQLVTPPYNPDGNYDQVNESGVNEGHGSVTITLISAQ